MPYTAFATSFPVSSTPPTAFAPTGNGVSSTPPTQFGTPDVVALADVTALKAVATVTLVVDVIQPIVPIVRNVVSAVSGEVVNTWELCVGTDADNVSGGVARPADFNASTNAKVWRRRL